MAKKKQDVGAEFEQKFQDMCDKLVSQKFISYVRLYDTKSARVAYMPNQPGDFIVAAGSNGHVVHL